MRKFKFARATGALFLLAALGAAAHADGGMTRAQVKAELAEAMRTGNMLAEGRTRPDAEGAEPGALPCYPGRGRGQDARTGQGGAGQSDPIGRYPGQ